MASPEVGPGDVVLPRADVDELQRMVAAYDALMDDDTIPPEQYARQARERAAALVGYLGAALGHARAGGR